MCDLCIGLHSESMERDDVPCEDIRRDFRWWREKQAKIIPLACCLMFDCKLCWVNGFWRGNKQENATLVLSCFGVKSYILKNCVYFSWR